LAPEYVRLTGIHDQQETTMKKLLLALVILASLISACTPLARAQLSSAHDRWRAANISHYRFDLVVSCFCAFRDKMPLTIEVQDGRPVSMQYKGGVSVTPEEQQTFSSYQTIDALFDYTAESLAKADQIRIQYDPTYGFPTAVQIDFVKNAMDDELSLYTSNFQKLP
jgi:hypothetical protein